MLLHQAHLHPITITGMETLEAMDRSHLCLLVDPAILNKEGGTMVVDTDTITLKAVTQATAVVVRAIIRVIPVKARPLLSTIQNLRKVRSREVEVDQYY